MNSFFEKLSITPFQLRVFIGSFLCMFTIVILQNLGVEIPRLPFINPDEKRTLQEIDVFERVKEKLQKTTNYRLKHITSFVTQAEAAVDYEQAVAYAVIDFDSGNIIAEKNIDKPFPIASLTKIMTAMTALDLANPNEYFTVSEKAAKEIPTKIGVVPGQKLRVEELLHAILLTSANDACAVLKEGIDAKYGDEVFIKAMNENAKNLGLKNTSFDNPQGYDSPHQYSSVGDIAILTHYVLKNYPLITEIVKKAYYFLPADEYHKQYDLYNWNGLIDVYPATVGVKIGNTASAKKTTVVLSERGGKKILVILLGAPGIIERDLWAAQLLDLGYKRTLGMDPIAITKEQLQKKYASWQYWH